jgi:subtilisin-like proprotein convertase family protein
MNVHTLGPIFLSLSLAACATAGNPSSSDGGASDKADAGAIDWETNCSDGVDDDGDGDRDCADVDCSNVPPCVPETNCTNGTDDNANGLIDCVDPTCDGVSGCEYGTEQSCSDGADNDGDSNADCADPDCAQEPSCVPETNCTNGLDDDNDGNVDCADFDCDGVGSCKFDTELSCTDGLDNDGDGSSDCSDQDCSVQAACVLSCPTGTSPGSAVAASLPMAIPDFGNAQTTASMSVAGAIGFAMVRVDLPHEFTGDLALTLVAPDGTTIDLSSGNGGFGAGYVATVFDDAAPTAVVDAVPPFTGTYRPEEPLAGLLGRPAAGAWRLDVADQAPFWTGSLETFAVYTCSCDCNDPSCDLPFCQPEADCANGIDDDADGDVDCADSDCSSTDVCAAESDCSNGIDDDNDGFTDCADPGCASSCETTEASCNDGVDNDGNGPVDCNDPACAFTCSLPECGAGQAEYQLVAGDLPLAIPDVATASSSIDVTKAGTVTRVAVRVSASHTYDADLDFTLRSPSGTTVDLSSGNGAGGDNYTNTVFVDSASTSIVDGSPPFTGSFQPEQALTGFTNQALVGAWSLDIADNQAQDTGSLTSFEVAFCATL